MGASCAARMSHRLRCPARSHHASAETRQVECWLLGSLELASHAKTTLTERWVTPRVSTSHCVPRAPLAVARLALTRG